MTTFSLLLYLLLIFIDVVVLYIRFVIFLHSSITFGFFFLLDGEGFSCPVPLFMKHKKSKSITRQFVCDLYLGICQ